MQNKNLIKHAFMVIAFLALIVLQSNLSSMMKIVNWTPDLILILLFLVAQIYGRRMGMIYGFFSGLMFDFTTSIIGFAALSNTLFGFLAGNYKFDENYNYVRFLSGLLTTSLIQKSVYHGLYLFGYQNFFETLAEIIIPEAVYTSVLGLMIYFLIEKWILELYVSRKS